MLLLFSFLWLAPVAFLTASPGIFELQDRIIGGRDTEIEEAPWQVSLQYDGFHTCGGSIYSEIIIITAAHCVHGKVNGRLSVRAGSSKHNSGGTLVKVAAVKYHERYTWLTDENDVAVVLLKESLALNQYINLIPLAKTDPAEGSKAISTGWGFAYLGKPIHLQSMDLKIEKRSGCLRKFSFVVHPGDICAGFPFKDACNGDSGGPLVVNGELVGITSRGGTPLCLGGGIYASIPHYRQWILTATKTF